MIYEMDMSRYQNPLYRRIRIEKSLSISFVKKIRKKVDWRKILYI